MRYLHALLDLPWWTGLPILLISNTVIPKWGMHGYILGSIGFLFGSWIFSKLVNYAQIPDTSGAAIVGLSVFFSSMYYFTPNFLMWEYGTLFVARLVLGLGSSLMAFEGFKYK